LFSDEDFSLRVVEVLGAMGHETLTTPGAGLAYTNTPDEQIVAAATLGRRAVLTYNRRDYGRIHLSGVEHAGIIVCTRDRDVRRQAARIHAAILANEPLTGKLIRVNRPGPAEERA
jgi:Domain of unknown function (DUF5615)